MNQNHKVAVFDPATGDLRRVPISQIDTSRYEKVQVPKLQRQFDLYAFKGPGRESDMNNSPMYAIIARIADDPEGRSHVARLYYSELGLTSQLQRLLSAKYRTLYIGSLPSSR
ncbi:MAG: hypothetical protein Q9219_000497 [cf. Caloplaca sp. 3 TL-2023]